MKFKIFIKRLLVPKTGVYILLGTIIMFLTFFTDDNALEIAISGIASIFIGIGVNNFTLSETHEKDLAEERLKMEAAVKIIEFAQSKVANTQNLFKENISAAAAQQQLEELHEFLSLGITQLRSST